MEKVSPVLFIIGLLVSVLGAAMGLPALVDLQAGNPDWQVFAGSSGVSLFFGVALTLAARTGTPIKFSLRQSFLLLGLAWLAIAAVGALPFAFSQLNLSVSDAFFEAMSGITTTGSTVIVGLDRVQPGILLWRALLQWLGGIGGIVMAYAMLPTLGIGGMQLFRTDGFHRPDKVLPRAKPTIAGLSAIYLLLTGACALGLWLAGLSGFDAIAHAMTTIATGGFSTHDASIGHFRNDLAEWIIIGGMIVGSLPFLLYLEAAGSYLRPRKSNSRALLRDRLRDSQIKGFFGVVAASVAIMTLWVWGMFGFDGFDGLRTAAFNVISILTGTGYTSTDFGVWGGFPLVLLLLLMFVGGCTTSTTCGVKVFRFQVLYTVTKAQLRALLLPHSVIIRHFNKRPISDGDAAGVMGFFALYIICFGALAAALAALGLDFTTAVSGAATAINNVGPGLGDVIGPNGTFKTLPESAKWLLSFGMLLGRVELFVLLVLLTPAFWTR